MNEDAITKVREFNRFYTVFIGILNKTYLHSKYSLAETRVLHATLTEPGIKPIKIIKALKIDKSYLSRMIVNLEKRKVIRRKKSKNDGRSIHLYITPFGFSEFAKLTESANKEVASFLSVLNKQEIEDLMQSMTRIKEILSKSGH